ncbi:Plasmodium exported protein (PHISTa), unknown, putative [Plasmodium sp.]|nr:Plasmodium exported protein (PHISTa), unknown, putative [Plasmodium sp.]
MHDIGETLSCTDIENTLNFYNLVKDGAFIDEIKHYIYVFINDFHPSVLMRNIINIIGITLIFRYNMNFFFYA